MAFERDFYKMMLKTGGCRIAGPSRGHINNVSGEYEWLKWLTYLSFHEKEVIKEMNQKEVTELSEYEVLRLARYREHARIADIIKANIERGNYDESYLEALDYMDNHDINKLILSKLSVFEKESLDKQVKAYLEGDEDQFKISLDIDPNDYMELSIYDAYVLREISISKYFKSIKRLMDECEYIDERNLVMSQKSSFYANNSKPCI